MEIKAQFKKQLDVVQHTATFKSRKVWVIVDYSGQYPQTIELQLAQDKVDLFNGVQEGQEVTCHLNLRGNEVTKDGKTAVFNSLVCWKVDKGNSTAQTQNAAPQAAVSSQPEVDNSDLPF